MGLRRTFHITVAYDGTGYGGWQVQNDVATVQGVVERAAEAVNGSFERVLGAGRTDAGVHARAQAARFRTERDLNAQRVPHALNAHLPEDVVVNGAREVSKDWHPIGDAIAKSYRYTFRVGEFDDPFRRRFVHRVPDALDMGAMCAAAGFLTGRYDFAPFEKSGSPRESTHRTLARLDVLREGDYIYVDFEGDGFLYGMARNLAGTLFRVGRGRLDPERIPDALAHGDRTIAGPCLPAQGLCLMGVAYRDPAGGDS
jgi:tRNA pseudouridine38-40 synthase